MVDVDALDDHGLLVEPELGRPLSFPSHAAFCIELVRVSIAFASMILAEKSTVGFEPFCFEPCNKASALPT